MRTALCTLLALGLLASQESFAADLVKAMVARYRNSTVFLKVNKTTSTGEVIEQRGTGFVISNKGHVLTSCHLVDKVIRDENGRSVARAVDSVEARGATGSRAGTLEEMAILYCEQGAVDVALLRFRNTALNRKPVPISAFAQPAIGDAVASMGFPLDTEFFARQGGLASETEYDTLLVDMTLNPGDSGAPVFDASLRVVGIVEAGYSGGARIGVVRPIRHGAVLLTRAGVRLVAINSSIGAMAAGSPAANPTVAQTNFTSAMKAFSAAKTTIPESSSSAIVTYPFAKQFGQFMLSGPGASSEAPIVNIDDIPAKPGFRVIDAKFVVTEQKGAEVVHVAPSADGQVARAAFVKKGTDASVSVPYVKGFIETTQVRIGAPRTGNPRN